MEHGITDEDASLAIETAAAAFEQANAIRYHAVVNGRGIGVVIKRGTFPPRVITVFILDEEWLS